MHATRFPRSLFHGFAGFALFFVLFFLPPSLYAWGEKGHRLIAAIAERRLDPGARKEIGALLGDERLVSVAGWADRIREARPETGHWHFVNIPFGGARYDAKRDCALPKKGDCVIGAVERFRRVLSDRNRPADERAEALRFLVHFIGDLHQPLHTSGRNDQGGNDLPVIFFGETRHLFGSWNLHAVWDSGLIERTGLDERGYLATLERWIAARALSDLQKGGVADWAMEAHRAVAGAYQIPKDRALSDRYYEKNLPVVNELLAKAGVRLAKVLNRAVQPKRKSKTTLPKEPAGR